MNRPALQALLGKHVNITSSNGGTWAGTLIGLANHPTMIINQADGTRLALPQQFTVTEAPQDEPAAPDPLARVVQTCSAYPAQWNAWTITGQYLYLRYRSGRGTVDAYDSTDSDTWIYAPDGGIARFDKDDGLDGEITLEEFLTAAGLELAPGAVVS